MTLLRGAMRMPSEEAMKDDLEAQMAWKRAVVPAHSHRASSTSLYTQAYHDQLLTDMRVATRRKGWHVIQECFAPYKASDYVDVLDHRRLSKAAGSSSNQQQQEGRSAQRQQSSQHPSHGSSKQHRGSVLVGEGGEVVVAGLEAGMSSPMRSTPASGRSSSKHRRNRSRSKNRANRGTDQDGATEHNSNSSQWTNRTRSFNHLGQLLGKWSACNHRWWMPCGFYNGNGCKVVGSWAGNSAAAVPGVCCLQH